MLRDCTARGRFSQQRNVLEKAEKAAVRLFLPDSRFASQPVRIVYQKSPVPALQPDKSGGISVQEVAYCIKQPVLLWRPFRAGGQVVDVADHLAIFFLHFAFAALVYCTAIRRQRQQAFRKPTLCRSAACNAL